VAIGAVMIWRIQHHVFDVIGGLFIALGITIALIKDKEGRRWR